MTPMESPHDLGFWAANPHLWVPPLLLALILAAIFVRRALSKKEPSETSTASEETEAPTPPAETATHPPAPAAPSTSKPVPAAAAVPEKPATLGSSLAKTRSGWLSKLGGLFSKDALTDSLYEELEEALLTSDVGPKTTTQLLTRLRERAKEEKLSKPEQLKAVLEEEILAIVAKNQGGTPLPESPKPLIVMVTGVNGAGKTTTIGKLAGKLIGEGKKVLLGAADTFRAAATEQLDVWAKKAGVEIVQGRAGSDPGAVAFDSVKAGEARGMDIVLLDTAGRLHTKTGLMDELTKIKRVAAKAMEGAPHEIWLVLDANTGQNASAQAREFHQALGLTGLILTKLDGTAKGGALIGVTAETGLPVKYVGVGERLGDLASFDPKAFVRGLFGENSDA